MFNINMLVPIQNKIKVPNRHFLGYAYYISEYFCELTILRFDVSTGWDELTVYIDDEEYQLDPSSVSQKVYVLKTKTPLRKVDLNYTQRIPKVIVQTGESEKLDNPLTRAFKELNPEYSYVFFDNKGRREFIKRHFDSNVVFAYDLLVPGAFQADLFRYCYIYICGGCYFDYKTVPLCPLREIIKEDDDYIICIDYERTNSRDINVGSGYLNSVLISEPKNSLFLDLINKCVENIVTGNTFNFRAFYILHLTGPTMVYETIQSKIVDKKRHLRLKYFVTGSSYCDFKIVELETDRVLFYKTDPVTEKKNHQDNNHYGKLWERGEVLYIYSGSINKYHFFVYPHSYPDRFSFSFSEDELIAKRTDTDKEWFLYLKVKVVDDTTNTSKILYFGRNKRVKM